jgi:hypothetical protein
MSTRSPPPRGFRRPRSLCTRSLSDRRGFRGVDRKFWRLSIQALATAGEQLEDQLDID